MRLGSYVFELSKRHYFGYRGLRASSSSYVYSDDSDDSGSLGRSGL
jgi:hypothetical protein